MTMIKQKKFLYESNSLSYIFEKCLLNLRCRNTNATWFLSEIRKKSLFFQRQDSSDLKSCRELLFFQRQDSSNQKTMLIARLIDKCTKSRSF